MGAISIWHWMVVLFWIAVIVVPFWRIVKRAGYGGAWSLFALVPLVNIILLWVFAFTRWPVDGSRSQN